MTDISDWKYFYKIDQGFLCSTNVMYTPLINPSGTIMCMLWDEHSEYQNDNPNILSADLINFFFKRELESIKKFQSYSWAPKLLDVNERDRKIFIEWNNNTINHILYNSNCNLNDYCPTWKEQIFQILKDIIATGYYKMALYPHCFYIDNGIIKTFDFYSCVGIKERYIPRAVLEGMIGMSSVDRFDKATTLDNQIDFEIFFRDTLNIQLAKYWPDNPFPNFYKKLL
jgi:hypothetical protein